jgi:hypothetical protein
VSKASEPEVVGVIPVAGTTAILNFLSILPVLHTTILEITLDVAGDVPVTYKSVHALPGALCPNNL